MIDNMGQLRNPFVIYGYKGAEYFCDRKKETKTICTALSNERNVVLISPRRIGKTGLIHHVFEQLKKSEPETKCFYMDINATRNVNQFIQLLAKTVVGQVDTFSQSAFRKILTLFSITISQEQQEESLKHIFDYLKQSGKRIYIAIDEFQQISEYPENSTEALLRSHIQFLPNVYFIFAGSSQHMMSEMFLSAQRPFYQSSQMVNLSPIDVHEYCEFANRWLSKEGIGMEDPSVTLKIMNAAKEDKNDVLTEIFRSKAVLVGSPTINNGISYAIAGLLEMIHGLKFKKKKAAAFGSYGWSGEGVKQISEKLQGCGFELVDDGLKTLWVPDGNALQECREYGRNFAKAVK